MYTFRAGSTQGCDQVGLDQVAPEREKGGGAIIEDEYGILREEPFDKAVVPCPTRDVMASMAKDLGTELEWIAVEHYNTQHPHVHIALRGLRKGGTALRMSREYVQQGIREIAEHLCTRQLGYRTQLDAAEAERREITEKRFTSN